MKVKSITDVITNSSSEVYTVINKNSVETLKNFINEFMSFLGSSKTCDDLFDIYLDHSEWEDTYREGNWKELTEEQKQDFIDSRIENFPGDWLPSSILIVKPKEKNIPESLINYLEEIGNTGINESAAVLG